MAKTIEGGRELSSGPGFRVVLLLDALGHVVLPIWAIVSGFTQRMDTFGFWMMILYAVGVVANDLGALGLNASAMTWRRRLALVAVLAAVWRGSPFDEQGFKIAAILVGAIVWIAILLEGRRVSRAVAEATGEQVLSADPTQPER